MNLEFPNEQRETYQRDDVRLELIDIEYANYNGHRIQFTVRIYTNCGTPTVRGRRNPIRVCRRAYIPPTRKLRTWRLGPIIFSP